MIIRLPNAAAVIAASTMALTPLTAAELPIVRIHAAADPATIFTPEAVNADQYRRWRHRDRDRVDAGDVIAGVAVIGAIAAIASAANKAKRERDARYSYPDRPAEYRAPSDRGFSDTADLDQAVDSCVREIERNSAIESVDRVERAGAGWSVSGRRSGGATFSCATRADGRIEAVDGARVGAFDDRQWDDQRYAAARQEQDAALAPAYPGGPIGTEADDSQYEAADAPDLAG